MLFPSLLPPRPNSPRSASEAPVLAEASILVCLYGMYGCGRWVEFCQATGCLLTERSSKWERKEKRRSGEFPCLHKGKNKINKKRVPSPAESYRASKLLFRACDGSSTLIVRALFAALERTAQGPGRQALSNHKPAVNYWLWGRRVSSICPAVRNVLWIFPIISRLTSTSQTFFN